MQSVSRQHQYPVSEHAATDVSHLATQFTTCSVTKANTLALAFALAAALPQVLLILFCSLLLLHTYLHVRLSLRHSRDPNDTSVL